MAKEKCTEKGLLLAARHDLLDLAGLADVPGHGLAVLAVAVPLGLLVPRAPLQLAHLLGLEVAVLPLLGLGVLVGHLLAEPAVVGLVSQRRSFMTVHSCTWNSSTIVSNCTSSFKPQMSSVTSKHLLSCLVSMTPVQFLKGTVLHSSTGWVTHTLSV